MKQEDVSPITPISAFLNERTTHKLIDLLDFLSNPTVEIHDEVLEKLTLSSEQPIKATHDDVFAFDKSLWDKLASIDITVPWWRLCDGPLSAEQIGSLYKALKIREECPKANPEQKSTLENIDESPGALLEMFRDCNAELPTGNNQFGDIKEKANELSSLLVELLVTKGRSQFGFTKNKHKGIWDWLLPTARTAYISIVKSINEDVKQREGEETTEKENETLAARLDRPARKRRAETLAAANESVAFFSILFLSSIAVQHIFDRCFINPERQKLFLLDSFQYIWAENPYLQLLCSLDPFLDTTNKDVIAAYLGMVGLTAFGADAHRYLCSRSYFVVTRAMTKDLDYEKDECFEAVNFLRLIVRGQVWNGPTGDTREKSIKAAFCILVDSISRSEVEQCISQHSDIGPCVNTYRAILTNSAFDTLNSDDMRDDDYFLDDVARAYTAIVANKTDRFGRPMRIGFVPTLDHLEFVDGREAYFGSLATLAISLMCSFDEQPWFEYGADPTRPFLDGTTTILRAGYPEHAVTFLGYCLFNISLSPTLTVNDFGFSVIHNYLDENNLWQYVEKYFAPFLPIISQNFSPSLSLATQLWIQGTVNRYSKAELHLIHSDPINTSSIQRNSTRTLPPWFDPDDTQTIAEIQKMTSAMEKFREDPREQWQRNYTENRYGDSLLHIIKTLESASISVFEVCYNIVSNSDNMTDVISDLLGKPLNSAGGMTLGWIAIFMKALNKGAKQKPDVFRQAVELAGTSSEGLAKLFTGIGNLNSEDIDDFFEFKNARNALAHDTKPITHQSAAKLELFYKRGFDVIYKLGSDQT